GALGISVFIEAIQSLGNLAAAQAPTARSEIREWIGYLMPVCVLLLAWPLVGLARWRTWACVLMCIVGTVSAALMIAISQYFRATGTPQTRSSEEVEFVLKAGLVAVVILSAVYCGWLLHLWDTGRRAADSFLRWSAIVAFSVSVLLFVVLGLTPARSLLGATSGYVAMTFGHVIVWPLCLGCVGFAAARLGWARVRVG
ncbi:MAG: hypothetical protein MUE97_01080, partial [Phycisphaerales bacterium]|nr:hypothetical protein [Phycisphaerales bacterium]